jgi:4-amino-4-deoxy-L-arabinose transferase-like glycosyltransferase
MNIEEKKKFWFLYALSGLVVLIGMFIPVMEVDAAQYASIAKQMLQEGSFLEIRHRDLNYLDKPPLLFWLSACSMWLFGIHDFAYKLPSVLFSVLGVWATFRLAYTYYGERAAHWSALMYVGSAAFFIYNSDIRTDTVFIALLVYSVYQLDAFRRNQKWLSLLGAFSGIGLAMAAKGPLGLVFPLMAIGPDIVLKRQWKFLFNWKWIPGLGITALVLAPVCYGLYSQYDARPDAWVNGEQGVSGLRFFFWTQSFGRITGESVWARDFSNNPGTFYLFTTFLWAFLPWTPVFLYSFLRKAALLVRGKLKARQEEEWITFFAFLLPLLALSSSGYQLNHYIYVVIPFTSILCASALPSLENAGRWKHMLNGYAFLYIAALGTLSFFILFLIFPGRFYLLFLLVFLLPLFLGAASIKKWYWSIAAYSISFFIIVNAWFYPQLLNYQGSKQAIKVFEENKKEGEVIYTYETGTCHSLDFYNHRWVGEYHPEQMPQQEERCWVYVSSKKYKDLHKTTSGKHIQIIDSFPSYRVTLLNKAFLFPSSREHSINYNYLLVLETEKQKTD